MKGFARRHEHIADFFSLLAVILFFTTIWLAIDFQSNLFGWIEQNILIRGPAVILALVTDVFAIFMLLNVGSTRFRNNADDHCFGTFRGRRHGGYSVGAAVRNWVHHIEQVNKKHR